MLSSRVCCRHAPPVCQSTSLEGPLGLRQAPTNGDGIQHGLQVGNVIQQHVEEGVQCLALPQQQLGGLNMLLLQGMNVFWERLPAEPSGVKACTAFLLRGSMSRHMQAIYTQSCKQQQGLLIWIASSHCVLPVNNRSF